MSKLIIATGNQGKVREIKAILDGFYDEICSLCGNVFEQAIEVPKRPHIKGVMRKCGADACIMSGSGPTVYGIFSDENKAKDAYDKLIKKYDQVYLCKPVKSSIEEI